jgi:hypothetical protein
MRDPYYAELTILESGAMRMSAMSWETREAVAERTIEMPDPEGRMAARGELVLWVRSWIKRHSPKVA